MTENKKKGPGAPKGRRPVVWVCSAIKDSDVVSEKFIVRDQDPEGDGMGLFPKTIAEKEFYDKHGVQPQVTLGPFFEKRGASGVKSKRKRLQIDRENIDKYKLGVKRHNAIFGDWKGLSNEIENNPDLSFFMFLAEVEPTGKKRNIPAPGIVKVEDLTFYR